jgi:hypothetical protein
MRHTLRNCRDFKHSIGHGRSFQPLPPPPPRGGPEEPRQPQKQEEGEGGAFPRVDREVNVIFGGHGSQENRRQQKLNDRQILVATAGPPAPYRWSEHPITFTRADQWLNFDHPGKYPLLVDPVIRESRVNGGSSINVTFPRTLQGLGVHLKELRESDTPFFGIVPTEGEYPLGHIYMPVTFGTLENYRTEFLRFEVANFDCGYNAIIGRPGLAKFMAIPHYTYMILKMPGPQGIITVRADFQGAAECFQVAIQAALTTKPSTTSSEQANSKPETLQHRRTKLKARPLCGRLKKLKGSTWGLLMNAILPSSAPAWTINRKARSSGFCKTTETYLHGNLRICREYRESWPSTN